MAEQDLDPRRERLSSGTDTESGRTLHPDEENEKGDSPSGVLTKETEATDDFPHGFRLICLIVATVFATLLVALDQTIVATAIPKITDQFHGLNKVSWYGSAYFMTFGGFQSLWGKAYKYFSLKGTFLTSIFIFEVGSLICGVAPNAVALIVGRAIAGVGGAGAIAGAFTIVAFAVPTEKRPLLTGLLGVTYGMSAVIGPLLGGAFTTRVSWRWCFYINLPIGGLAAALVVLFFTNPKAAQTAKASGKEKLLQMDPVGVSLVMAFIICFTLALQYGGQTYAWSSSVVIGLFVGFGLILIAFIIWEIFQGERAMIVPRLFKRRVVFAGALFQMFYAGAYFILLYYIPIYFQSIDNASPIGSGVRNLPMVIAVSIAGMAGGIAVSATGYAIPYTIVSAAFATVGSGLIYTWDIGTGSDKWIGYQVLAGFFFAFAFMIAMNTVQANSAPEDMSSATAIIFFFQMLGGAFGLSAAQSAFANRIIATLPAGVSSTLVVATGATELRTVFTSEAELAAVLVSYMHGIKGAFAVSIGMVGVSFLLSPLNTWKKLHNGGGDKSAMVAMG